MDTDRLAEEKRRGISIDLGFAHLTLPGGEQLSFVDVPGHERFIRNMLAGAAGIEAVLLVIAADESVKPQTREHFDICRLLHIERGLIVLTKADLATPEQLARTQQDARLLTQGSFLENAPLIPVSSVTGAGLEELKTQLAKIAATAKLRAATGLPRLPVDRSFALKGFGTVVTGTLWSGQLAVGDIVRIHPLNLEARIRGLQRHGESVKFAVAGDRTAVNLSGVDHTQISRGFTLTSVNALETTLEMDVSIDWLTPLTAREFLLDIATAEVPATLKPLGEHFSRLHLAEPVLALPGDRFILRRPSPSATVAGGTVIDPFPLKRLNRMKTRDRLRKLQHASLAERVDLLVDESASGLTFHQLERLAGQITQTPNVVLASDQHVLSKRWIEERQRRLIEWLKDFHAKNPAAEGAPLAQARLGIDPALIWPVFSAVNVRADLVSLPGFLPKVSNRDAVAKERIELAFRQAGFTPPASAEVLRR